LMGNRMVGHVEVLESNHVRARLVNTWYFPTRAGEWASLAVRQIRWEHTIYGDGRWVTGLCLNNAGGGPIDTVRLWLVDRVAWSAGATSRDFVVRDFQGPIGRWSFLRPSGQLRDKTLLANHMRPGKIEPLIGAISPSPTGDLNGDGFDESQGCYRIRANGGHCRFRIVPTSEGLLDPAFLVLGNWPATVVATVQGRAVRRLSRLDDGSVVFTVLGWIRQPTVVEVAG